MKDLCERLRWIRPRPGTSACPHFMPSSWWNPSRFVNSEHITAHSAPTCYLAFPDPLSSTDGVGEASATNQAQHQFWTLRRFRVLILPDSSCEAQCMLGKNRNLFPALSSVAKLTSCKGRLSAAATARQGWGTRPSISSKPFPQVGKSGLFRLKLRPLGLKNGRNSRFAATDQSTDKNYKLLIPC